MCGKIKFYSKALMLNYCQNLLNSCCFIISESAFAIIKQTKAANDIAMRIEESLKSEVFNHIYFANAILKNKSKTKGKQKVYYSLRKYKKWDILIF